MRVYIDRYKTQKFLPIWGEKSLEAVNSIREYV